MARPKYFIFDRRTAGGVRKYQDAVKISLIVLLGLSVGLHLLVLFRSSLMDGGAGGGSMGCPDVVQQSAVFISGPRSKPAPSASSWSSSSDHNSQVERGSAGGRRPVAADGRLPAAGADQQPAAAAAAGQAHISAAADALPLDDAVGKAGKRKDYKALWRYYRLTANVSDSPYARPRQPLPPHKNMADVYKSNGSQFGNTVWDRFHAGITPYQLYQDPAVVDAVLKDVQTAAITKAEMKDGGTQLKLFIEFEGPGKALFKPLRLNNTQEDNPNHFYFNYFERHYSEIAAYHLDRVLGFRRAPPVTGRMVNLITDVRNRADDNLRDTFYISPAGNICLTGACKYYCDTSHGLCGSPENLPGSFSAFLPEDDGPSLRMTWRHPWRRSYSRLKLAPWEMDNTYCLLIKTIEPYDAGRRMLDIMDMAILDYIANNLDRHHYETFYEFGNESSPIHLDHGRSFNKWKTDDPSILTPLTQCCLIRRSTLKRLLDLTRGPKLSHLLDESMRSDPLYPVLNQEHLDAVDRRVHGALDAIETCLRNAKNPSDIIIQEDLKSWKL